MSQNPHTVQDWEPVVLRKRGASDASGSGSGSGPKHVDPYSRHMAKVADSEIAMMPKMFTPESIQAIVNYRKQNNLTQKQMDNQCSFPSNTINHLEAKKVAPTPHQLNTLNRILKSGLTLQ
jgi:hypothetical protein